MENLSLSEKIRARVTGSLYGATVILLYKGTVKALLYAGFFYRGDF